MSELLPCPFVRLSQKAIAQFLEEGAERISARPFHDPEATFWRHVLQQLHAYAAPLQQETDKDGELTKIGFLLRPRSGDIHFIQRIETLPLAVHETMEVFAALPQKDSKI